MTSLMLNSYTCFLNYVIQIPESVFHPVLLVSFESIMVNIESPSHILLKKKIMLIVIIATITEGIYKVLYQACYIILTTTLWDHLLLPYYNHDVENSTLE